MKTDENTEIDGPTWWMNAVLGLPSGNQEHDMMREAALYRLFVAQTDLALHLKSASRHETSDDAAREVSANLIAAAALSIQREQCPKAHSALLQSCAAKHPDLANLRESILAELRTKALDAAVLRRWLKALSILTCVLTGLSGIFLGIILSWV